MTYLGRRYGSRTAGLVCQIGGLVDKTLDALLEYAKLLLQECYTMYQPLTDEEKQRMKARRDVVAKGITYVAVIVFLFVINMITSSAFHWWVFPALGMGLGFVKDFVKVFVQEDYSEDPKERRKRERRERREARRRGLPAPQRQREEDSLELSELDKIPDKAYRNEDLV